MSLSVTRSRTFPGSRRDTIDIPKNSWPLVDVLIDATSVSRPWNLPPEGGFLDGSVDGRSRKSWEGQRRDGGREPKQRASWRALRRLRSKSGGRVKGVGVGKSGGERKLSAGQTRTGPAQLRWGLGRSAVAYRPPGMPGLLDLLHSHEFLRRFEWRFDLKVIAKRIIFSGILEPRFSFVLSLSSLTKKIKNASFFFSLKNIKLEICQDFSWESILTQSFKVKE